MLRAALCVICPDSQPTEVAQNPPAPASRDSFFSLAHYLWVGPAHKELIVGPSGVGPVLAFQSVECNNSATMVIGDRLRELREEKKLSQGDIEKRTGLLRCYISRVENGHTVPAIATLEKMARALEVPMYKLFYDSAEPPKLPSLPVRKSSDNTIWGSSGKDAKFLNKLRRLLGKSNEEDRKVILYTLQKMAR